MNDQMTFEGMEVNDVRSKHKQFDIPGLERVKIGNKVRLEIEAICVGVGHQFHETDGGLRHQTFESLPEGVKVLEVL